MEASAREESATGITAGVCFLAAFGLAGASAAFVAQSSTTAPRIDQPIQFSHRVHVEGQELECSACHPSAAREARAGFPEASTCRLCHGDPQGETAEEARLVALLNEGGALEWRSVFREPEHVFFSHARHVTVAHLECAQCHGDIAEAAAPPPLRHEIPMEECVACHEQRDVTIDCTACHR